MATPSCSKHNLIASSNLLNAAIIMAVTPCTAKKRCVVISKDSNKQHHLQHTLHHAINALKGLLTICHANAQKCCCKTGLLDELSLEVLACQACLVSKDCSVLASIIEVIWNLKIATHLSVYLPKDAWSKPKQCADPSQCLSWQVLPEQPCVKQISC